MAEVNSRQAAKIALGQKLADNENGKVRTLVFQTPATFTALAIDDTLASGQYIPEGARILGCRISNSAGTASSTVNIGLRKRSDGTVISATAITSLIAITSATTTSVDAGNGAYIAAGVAQTLADEAEVYLTAKGAVLAANQLVRVEVTYIGGN